MAGLIKQKQYDWKDTNLALFGSDTEKEVKKSSAACEPAWRGAGQKPGLQIWRIVNFKVTSWPRDDYGKFYDGDSYIILNTYKIKDSDQLLYDVHFWIGKYSTQDEYGTAAYKTVELDTYLDDVPIQHREVQGHESKLFKSYFTSITILRGGADSGFRSVKPTEYSPRLLHFHGERNLIEVKEIPRCRDLLDSSDVYILDLGLTLYQWNGRDSNKDERFKAARYLMDLKNERGGKCRSETFDQTAGAPKFYRNLTETTVAAEEDPVECSDARQNELFRLSDASGSLMFELEKKGQVSKKDFDSNDVFIFDTQEDLFVWIGRKTTLAERQNAMVYAHNYLKNTNHPLNAVTCLKEGGTNETFDMAIAA